jgi:hypothetical protein
MALFTSSPSPLPLSGAPAAVGGKSKKKRAAASDDANSRPSATRDLSTASTTSTSTNSDPEMSKTRRGLSKILLTAKGNKSSSGASIKSVESSKEKSPAASVGSPPPPLSSGKADGSNEDDNDDDDDDGASLADHSKTANSNSDATRRIAFLTEQVSHHPPISSFFVECKEAGVELYGVDQLSAKFTGTSECRDSFAVPLCGTHLCSSPPSSLLPAGVRIFPGEHNKGIFLRLTKNANCGAEGEEYQITHPTASINGMLRGSLWVAICETLFVTCRGGKREGDSGTRLKAIVEYKDEVRTGFRQDAV